MRQAADPSFSFKLAVECGLDACIIIVVNLLARGERFAPELDFVLCQVRLQSLCRRLHHLYSILSLREKATSTWRTCHPVAVVCWVRQQRLELTSRLLALCTVLARATCSVNEHTVFFGLYLPHHNGTGKGQNGALKVLHMPVWFPATPMPSTKAASQWIAQLLLRPCEFAACCCRLP